MFLKEETEKYERIWKNPEYRRFSPAERFSRLPQEVIDSRKKEGLSTSVIDLGCGEGRGGKALINYHSINFLDLVAVSDFPDGSFIKGCLWEDSWRMGQHWDLGYCADVLEHIPPEMVGLAVYQISQATEECIFSVGLTESGFDEDLHLTVRPFTWWKKFLSQFGEVLESRDVQHCGLYHARW